jgi:hypothetical protein
MRVELLDVVHYPRPGWMPWHTIETPNPDWPAIEAAIRRLDRREWPFVTLHTVAPVDGKVPIHALTVMGGRGEYTLFLSEGDDEVYYEDAARGRSPVRIWESDQGSVVEERSLCDDLERVLAIARHFAERAELDPSVTWVRW